MRNPRMLRISFVVLLLLGATALSLNAQEPAPRSNSAERPNRNRAGIREFLGLGPAPDAVAAERGQKLYAPSCGFCHGEKGRGAGAPNLLRSVLVLHDEKGEVIGPYLEKGVPEKGMPAFPSLTKAQVYDIAQYLHMEVELAANRGLYRRLNVISGDPDKGRKYFNEAGRCADCHSIKGDLARIGSKYSPDVLQNKFLWPDSGGAARPRRATVTLPSGEKIAGTIKRLDDFHVSIHDAAGNFYSWSRDGDNVRVTVDDPLAGHRALLDKYSDQDIHDLLAYLVTLK